jgi:hypothetical protein
MIEIRAGNLPEKHEASAIIAFYNQYNYNSGPPFI